MLKSDSDDLTPHDIASAATWADKYRDFNNRKDHYIHTRNWHFVDLEIDNPDLKSACFNHPLLPQSEPASGGPDEVCATNKIKQFEAELRSSNTDAEERVIPARAVAGKYYSNCARITEMAFARLGVRKFGSLEKLARSLKSSRAHDTLS
jgi:hypothetical protein